MEVIHRFFSNGNVAFRKFLDSHSIPYEREKSIVGDVVSLEICESDAKWPSLRGMAAAPDVLHSTRLQFSAIEIRRAEWAQLHTRRHTGYPQPQSHFGYKSVTYAASCPSCDIGHMQAAPFRLKSHPKGTGARLIQLNWVFDEFFVSTQARKALESGEISGLEFLPVILHPTGRVIADWFQLRVSPLPTPAVMNSGLERETCARCGAVKVHYPEAAPLRIRRNVLRGVADIVRLDEWFGSGHSAHRPVLVSQHFVNVALTAHLRNVHFVPVSLTELHAA